MQTVLKLIRVPIPENGLHLLIKAKIGRRFYYLILDTGASESVLDKSLPENLFTSVKVNEDAQTYGIQSENIKTKTGIVKTFALGELKLKNQSFHLVDLSQINELYSNFIDYQINGLIGSDFLNQFQATISYKTGKLTLRY